MRAGPDVGAVERGENRGVADNLDVELRGQFAQLRPLAEKQILNELVGFRAELQLRPQGRLLRRAQGANGFRPFPPRTSAEVIFERGKQSVASQPARIVLPETREVPVR